MRFFVSGMPGVGKTTLAKRIADEVRREGFKVGGIITEEIREGGKRTGFRVIALDTGEIGRLAYVGYGYPRLESTLSTLKALKGWQFQHSPGPLGVLI